MSYYFFFSYCHHDDGETLNTFFDDLEKAFKRRVGFDKKGFKADSSIRPGKIWTEAIEKALCKAKVFISILTANSLRSNYCGQEWAFFDSRCNGHMGCQKDHGLIIPVLWVCKNDLGLILQNLNFNLQGYIKKIQMDTKVFGKNYPEKDCISL